MKECIVCNILHFYYCLLVNIKLRKHNLWSVNESEHKRLTKKWLINAKEKKIFDPITLAEITWLLTEVDRRTSSDFEKAIHRVYLRGSEIFPKLE